MIDFAGIERKWQRKWEKEKAFEAKDLSKKPKYYLVEMYPYPSGSGLHMGHAFNYSIGDIHARIKRMNGFNVLYPMGFDSFGLPAENAAIKAKSHPKKFTEDAIKNYILQMKSLGLSYDWSRKVESHKTDYYKWDQWIFLKMFEKGLAYRKKAPVNYCSKCKTVLANEQVINGKCWRHEESDVEIKHLEQWFFKITDYADELYEGIDKLEGWPELIKKSQKNWIGKSHGTEIDFEAGGKTWNVFTTRADTLFGVTFLVVSAQHPELMDLVTEDQKKDVEKFLKKIKSTKEEDIDKLDKEGAFTGSYAIHPLTGEEIPIWTGNYVAADYGSGMVMGVPAHDPRDWEFAQKYKITVKQVIGCPKDYDWKKGAYTGWGNLVNSEGFNGLKSREAIEHITNALEMKGKGRKKVAFRLRDWLISRQRFWGAPIPIVYCDSCGIVPVNEKDLPVRLPDNIKFSSEKNPLADSKNFVNVKCPKCGKTGKRETDTMDTFMDSSWYFLRYCDPKNEKKIFDSRKANYWMPMDMYIGGKEHATLHLIYFRFLTKFFRDMGLIDKKISEPAKVLFNQGMLHAADGTKMSKSKGNVVSPESVSKRYGIDTARLFLVSIASPDKDINWDEKGVEGSLRFVLKVMDFAKRFKKNQKKLTKLQESKLNRLVKDYSHGLENFRYNLAIIKLRELFDVLEEGCDKKSFEIFLKLLSPVCPHIAEELWSKLGNKNFVSVEKWPKYDENKIDEKLEERERQVEKTVEDAKNILKIMKDKKQESGKVYVYVLPNEREFYDGKKLGERLQKDVKVFTVNDKSKHDPENKSKKVKPGRPGIYIE